MMYGIYFKISNEMIKDKELTTSFINSYILKHKKKLYKQGQRFMKPFEIKFFPYDNGNIVKNATTTVITGQVYKIPRFIKKYLLNK